MSALTIICFPSWFCNLGFWQIIQYLRYGLVMGILIYSQMHTGADLHTVLFKKQQKNNKKITTDLCMGARVHTRTLHDRSVHTVHKVIHSGLHRRLQKLAGNKIHVMQTLVGMLGTESLIWAFASRNNCTESPIQAIHLQREITSLSVACTQRDVSYSLYLISLIHSAVEQLMKAMQTM